jgi:hypothetical protein
METMELTRTQSVIESQLLENTGKHFLDSGSAYGRHFERNNKTGIDFTKQLTINAHDVIIPIQVFMDTMLDYTNTCETLENALNDVNRCYSNQDEIKEILEALGAEFEANWFNTYNWDNDLSQDLQGCIFEFDGDKYVILETHNGCDIRGGYSDARIYEIRDYDYFLLGQIIEVTNPLERDGNPFESLYQAYEAGMAWNEETDRYEFPDGSEAEFYTSALGF